MVVEIFKETFKNAAFLQDVPSQNFSKFKILVTVLLPISGLQYLHVTFLTLTQLTWNFEQDEKKNFTQNKKKVS